MAAVLGDMAMGIAAFALRGMLDLINAGLLGGLTVVPWLVERHLPLFGVPIMPANHVQTIKPLMRNRRGRLIGP